MTLNKSNKQLNELLGIVCTLYPNGIFNALDVDTVTKDKLLSKYKHSAIIENLSAQYYRNDNGNEMLRVNDKYIPYNKNFISKIDKRNKKIYMHDIEAFL